MTTFSFHGCFSGAIEPTPADPALEGSPPFRAVTHCEPFRAAAGHGWYTRPPLDCSLKWDGASFAYRPSGSSEWLPLQHLSVADVCRLRGVSPPQDITEHLPVLSALPEPGVLQIWTGLLARTAPGWHLLVRGIPNRPGSLVHEVLEGVVESDWWHGPLIANLRFRRTDEEVRLSRHLPLLAVQPVRAEALRSGLRRETAFHPYGPGEPASAVAEFLTDAMSVRREGAPGGYRAEVARRRRAGDDGQE
ncbi:MULTISPECIES: DUF6065 family protein [unclassified Streptomyces]|uniref:DUF6065 family protein n=1 Tax=unclassified Streptomyces TaxID=2593676 RepID=UPI0020255744|nr:MULTISPECIES: DUF6065 family protein [unclassified Streptomyces]MCX4553861.1 DUF6065 family protein [Streptomyces sp. NBC_01500]